jgi:hypothetical protein
MFHPRGAVLTPILGLFVFVFIAVSIGIAILYILTLRRALTECAPHNRATSPDSPWLLLIPFFNLVWGFILYPRISESLEREFRQRNLPIEPEPAKSLGLTLAILQACGIVPVVNIFTGIAGLICYILYWIKISGYANQLAAAPAAYYPTLAAAPAMPQPYPSAMPPALHCTGCGAPVRTNERFCANCGKPVV